VGEKAVGAYEGGAMNRILQAVFVLLLALLMVFSLPYGSPARADEHEEKSTATAQGGQASEADYKGITSGVSSAGAGAATGLKEAAFAALIVGVVVAGALFAASVSSDAGPIPTTSHHP